MWYPKVFNTNQALYKAIADAIERDIHQGILKQGDKMPPQRQLADRIGVNLTTITRAYREALKRDLIETFKGDGTYVKTRDNDSLTNKGTSQKPSSFEFGFANPGTSSTEPLADILRTLSNDRSKLDIFNYVENIGLMRHRDIAAKWLSQYGFRNLNANQVIITNGAMNAIVCFLVGILKAGDTIATDTLTFAGLIGSAKLHHINLVPIEMDNEGMMPDVLDAACKAGGIKAVYLMPNMHNPTSKVMSDQRKSDIAAVIVKHDILLIEDDIFSFTNLDSTSAISAQIPHNSFFICSLSKVLYPGLRIAFAKVPDQYYHQYVDALIHTVWMASPLNAEIITQIIESGIIHKLSADNRALISKRQHFARQLFDENVLSSNQESMYIWLTLPDRWTSDDFEHVALLNGIRIISANKFFVGKGTCPNAVRISLTSEPDYHLFCKGLTKLNDLLFQTPQLLNAIM